MGLSPGRRCRIAAATLSTLLAAAGARAQDDLVSLSLEELGGLTITSVARREQRLGDAPASLFVITADDIRRSGFTRLPDVLRLAPNLHVAEVYRGGYAISARGFNGNSANKLLVLLDGRSVYTPLFAGVFWDAQDAALENVERIEVSSGPGGTLWGVNAVNGVINIITKSAAATRGTLVSAAAGPQERSALVRHGVALDGGNLRLFLKHSHQRRTETADGTPVEDAGELLQAGFRADWGRAGDRFTLQGRAYRGQHGQPEPGSISLNGIPFELGGIRLSGAHLLARWERPVVGGDLSVQGYLDRTTRVTTPTFDEQLLIADLELLYTLRPTAAQTVSVGANHRRSRDRVGHATPWFAFLPERLHQAWTSLFAQDEIALTEALRLTLGVRAERNDYTGTEWLPNLRLAWKPAPDHLWWAAASRTVRAPSRLDRDVYVPVQPPFLLYGDPGFRAETANVLELGYRGQPLPALRLSATAFHGAYDHLRTAEQVAVDNPQLHFGNGMRGRVNGVEAWAMLQALRGLRLHAGVTLLRPQLRLKPGSLDIDNSVAMAEGAMPRQLWRLRAAVDLAGEAELDVTLRHVGALQAPDVPGYTTADLRLGRRLGPDAEIALIAQNLAGGGHGEFGPVATRTEVGRNLLLQARWHWR